MQGHTEARAVETVGQDQEARIEAPGVTLDGVLDLGQSDKKLIDKESRPWIPSFLAKKLRPWRPD